MSRLYIEPRYISLLGQFTESFLGVLYVCALCDITINSKQPLNTLNGSLPIPTLCACQAYWETQANLLFS